VFELASATDSSWAPRVVADLPDLLVDHAHCEKKAAGMAVNLIFRYPDHAFLLEPLSRLAREELAHFEEVLRLMTERGIAFRAIKPAPYAGKLKKAARTYEPVRLLDTLLFGVLIEARSCERFQLLAAEGPDAGLRHFYSGLLAAEARHRGVYLDLALELSGADAVAERFPELAALEAEVLAQSPELPRMHAA
jgi:tRNA-(ms[2]io[6]A)-hydroxylase